MDVWYFAYGSNLWIDQMIARTGTRYDVKTHCRIASLANHRLVFQRVEIGGAAYANVLSPGEGVFGVLYRCSSTDLEILDRYEQGYDRQLVSVTLLQNEELAAVAYIMRPTHKTSVGQPGAEYLQRIVTGARQHGLPAQYINQVIALASAKNE